MNRKPFQTLETFVYCKECGKEHHFWSVTSYGLSLSLVRYSRDSNYSPPWNVNGKQGYDKDILDLRTCLDHTKGKEVINHYDRKVILLKKVEN